MYTMLRLLALSCLLALAGFAVFWVVTKPRPLPAEAFANLSGDATRGETVFWAGGCASCHSGENAEGDARMILAGGRAFATDFGTFYAPNISPSDAGIKDWSVADLGNAMMRGVSPKGQHYYPAFPYTSYVKATPQDVADLHAFMQTLPADDTANRDHDVGFPFSIRRVLGGWKFLFFKEDWVMADLPSPDLERGRYLVEALGHCAECHTERNALGGLNRSKWLAGAAAPHGPGRIPALTPDALDWSDLDIASYLTTGFTPEFDSAGGEMAEVVQNMAHLPKADIEAMVAYLNALPH